MFSPRKLLHAAFAFFAGMSSVGMGLFVAFAGFTADSLSRSTGLIGFAGIAAIGYCGALLAARPNLRPDAGVGGRRDIISGILAIVLVLVGSIATQGAPLALRFSIILLAGALSALLMYFPWLQRQRANLDAPAAAADA